MTPVAKTELLMSLPSDQDSSGRTFDETEIAYVTEVLKSGTLTTTKGKFGKTLEQKFAEKLAQNSLTPAHPARRRSISRSRRSIPNRATRSSRPRSPIWAP